MAAIEAKVVPSLPPSELEVGIDTFRLVEEDDPTQHVMHTERYHVSQEVVDAVHKAKAEGPSCDCCRYHGGALARERV